MNSRKCEVCNIDVQRASFVKHMRNKKHLENTIQNEMFIPDVCLKNLLKMKLINI